MNNDFVGMETEPYHCDRCGEVFELVFLEPIKGGYTCPLCGCYHDKKKVTNGNIKSELEEYDLADRLKKFYEC